MLYVRIAVDLVASLDSLIAVLADDPLLASALTRERTRLINHLLEQLLGCADAPETRLPARPARPASAAKRAAGLRAWSRFSQVRETAYRALAAGCLSSQRFDALMLLALRVARRCGNAQTSSSSESPPESCEESSGAGAGSGSSGWLMTGGGCEPWPSRTKRITASTMRVCA